MSKLHPGRESGEAQDNPFRVVLGPLNLDPLTLSDAMQRIDHAVQGDAAPLHVVTANMQFLGLATKDESFAQVVRRAGLVVPDGMPLIWLCRLQRSEMASRITGHDLLHATAELAQERGHRVAFLGASPEVAQLSGTELQRLYPGLNIVGAFQGSFAPDGTGATQKDEYDVTQRIREAKVDVLFVALGCPKQEMWIARHQQAAAVPVAMGIGGVLDVLAGRFRRAPAWAQRAGLEWLYRLAQDPKRLWRRYVLQDMPTLAHYTMNALSAKSTARDRRT